MIVYGCITPYFMNVTLGLGHIVIDEGGGLELNRMAWRPVMYSTLLTSTHLGAASKGTMINGDRHSIKV